MPAQMPPARVIAGESVSTMIMSRPEAMPASITPTTVAVNGSAVFPFSTVSPLATIPGTRSATGNAAGHGSAGAACAADVDSQVAASAALINAAKAALGTRLTNGRLVVMTLLLMGLPVHTLDVGDSSPDYRHARYPVDRPDRARPRPTTLTWMRWRVVSLQR